MLHIISEILLVLHTFKEQSGKDLKMPGTVVTHMLM